DGELANKLMHPKSNVTKIYYAELDKPLTKKDMQSIAEGVELGDGFIAADSIDYDGDSKKEVGIEIHSGKNHIVKRIFEHFGYEVVKLDRTLLAGMTKKNLPRGAWRFLTENEVSFLKMI
ncbi:MAG: pseudouridine synthase, partial [Bacteroidales bacterium]|nr:pseudouridine synthase [Bacteroidales bacterium]